MGIEGAMGTETVKLAWFYAGYIGMPYVVRHFSNAYTFLLNFAHRGC